MVNKWSKWSVNKGSVEIEIWLNVVYLKRSGEQVKWEQVKWEEVKCE